MNVQIRHLGPVEPLDAWSWRQGLLAAAAGVLLAVVVSPLDGAIASYFRANSPRGDLRRELEFVQQFGAITSCVLIAGVIAMLDAPRRRVLPRAVGAIVATAAGVWVLKCLIGRPRPRLDEPSLLLGPWQTFTWTRGGEPLTAYAWEFWKGPSDLWSMPSSHTSAACALACVLARLYPRLIPLMVLLAALVGTARVVLGAHYPSDVIVGATLGLCIAAMVPLSSRRLPRT
jgi:membrane-associated phospholipid phosphatase